MTVTPGWIHAFLDVPRARWEQSVAFWSSVTGWSASDPRGESRDFVTLLPGSGDAWLKLQAVDGQARVHLDLEWTGRSSAVDRAIDLGAQLAWRYDEVAVMRSPGGLRFFHTLEEHPHRFARTDADGVLDQVCLDIPTQLWGEELAFWKALTGRELEHGLRTEIAFLGDPDPHGALRILLQRLDSSHGQVRAHLDFAVADRARQTARHAAAGAQVVKVMGRWTVMRAPDRHVSASPIATPRAAGFGPDQTRTETSTSTDSVQRTQPTRNSPKTGDTGSGSADSGGRRNDW